jgi:hypothetical protein
MKRTLLLAGLLLLASHASAEVTVKSYKASKSANGHNWTINLRRGCMNRPGNSGDSRV